MSDLLTQCPHCMTSFKVSAPQIDAAEGLVRCGSCLGLFSASLNLIRIKPPLNTDQQLPAADDDSDTTLEEDDISLGDMDLDAGIDDEDDDEDPEAEVAERAWEPYEEYQENADLFDNLPPEDDSDEAEADDYDDEDADYDEFDEDYDEATDEDDTAQSEDEFDSAGLVDLEDEEQEYEYSRIVLLEEDLETAPEDDLDNDDQEDMPALQEPERRGREKARLRRFLSGLKDDEALEPLGDADLEPLDEEPVTLAVGRQRRQLQQIGFGLLALVLLLTLGLQFVNHHLEALNQRNSFAPFKPLVCRILDCPVAATPSSLDSLYSQELLVRTHPRTANALEVSFIFRNDAAEAQPFPGLELSFRDINNELLANRLFRPADYLPPELRPLALMPPDSSVQIRLELLDPGADAVNYTMAFREL